MKNNVKGVIGAAYFVSKECKYIIMAATVIWICTFSVFLIVNASVNSFVETWQQYGKKLYGDYLAVVHDPEKEEIAKIKSQLSEYCIDEITYIETLTVENISIDIGWIESDLYTRFDIELVYGKWPEKEKEIVIEEYTAYLLGIDNASFPRTIIGEDNKEYIVTGIISNYAYKIACEGINDLDHKPYPTALVCNGIKKEGKVSLVITPKEWKWEEYAQIFFAIQRRMFEIGSGEEEVRISGNSQLDIPCYANIRDFYSTKDIFNIMSLSFFAVIFLYIYKVFMDREGTKIATIQALGLTRLEVYCSLIVMWLIDGLISIGVSIGISAGVFALLYKYFGLTSSKGILLLFVKAVSVLMVIYIGVVIGYSVFFYVSDRACIANKIKKVTKNVFCKRCIIDFRFLIIVFLATFSMMAIFYVGRNFSGTGEQRYRVSSMRGFSYNIYEDYYVPSGTRSYLNMDIADGLDEYRQSAQVKRIAETGLASIIIDEEHILAYRDYELIVVPDDEFGKLLASEGVEKTINNAVFAYLNNTETRSENAKLLKKNMIIQLSQASGNVSNPIIVNEPLKVVGVINSQDSSDIPCFAVSRSFAEQSQLIIGYEKVKVVQNNNMEGANKAGLVKCLQMLAASGQDSVFVSTDIMDEEDELFKKVTEVIFKNAVALAMLMACAYVIFAFLADYLKYKNGLAIIRGMGASETKIYWRLIERYIIATIVGIVCACCCSEIVMGVGSVNKNEKIISGMVIGIAVIVNLVIIYSKIRRTSISDMMKK